MPPDEKSIVPAATKRVENPQHKRNKEAYIMLTIPSARTPPVAFGEGA